MAGGCKAAAAGAAALMMMPWAVPQGPWRPAASAAAIERRGGGVPSCGAAAVSNVAEDCTCRATEHPFGRGCVFGRLAGNGANS